MIRGAKYVTAAVSHTLPLSDDEVLNSEESSDTDNASEMGHELVENDDQRRC